MTHYSNSKNKQKTIYVNKKLNNKGKWIGLFKKKQKSSQCSDLVKSIHRTTQDWIFCQPYYI